MDADQRVAPAQGFGAEVRRLRISRGMTRNRLLNRFYPLIWEYNPYDEKFYYESWVKRLEGDEIVTIRLYIVEALLRSLRCTQAEQGVLLAFLVPDIEGLRRVRDALQSDADLSSVLPEQGLHGEHRLTIAFQRLTARQREVLKLGAQGMTSEEIAAQLVVSKGTVDTHWNRIRKVFDLGKRDAIIQALKKAGIV